MTSSAARLTVPAGLRRVVSERYLMRDPEYALRLSSDETVRCVDCEAPTGCGVVGHRNGHPLCDACFFDQNPKLATPLAIMALSRLIGAALRDQRPVPDPRIVVQLANACEEADGGEPRPGDVRRIRKLLDEEWRQRWAVHLEVAQEMRYDLRLISRRLEADGISSKLLDDPDWVAAVAREAEKLGVEAQALIEQRAREAGGRESG